MAAERVLQEAVFSRKAVPYHVVPAAVLLCLTVVGVVAALVVVPVMFVYRRLQYEHLEVVLTTRDLKVRRGIFNREEKTIPLEKITDLAVFQGPIMRLFGVDGMRVETAGQSSSQGALVTIVGIEDTAAFRDRVLNQRDRIADRGDEPAPAADARTPAAGDAELLRTVRDMRDTLVRIEALLRERR